MLNISRYVLSNFTSSSPPYCSSNALFVSSFVTLSSSNLNLNGKIRLCYIVKESKLYNNISWDVLENVRCKRSIHLKFSRGLVTAAAHILTSNRDHLKNCMVNPPKKSISLSQFNMV